MDKGIAAALLASLVERAQREEPLGRLSSLEIQALQRALQSLQEAGYAAPTPARGQAEPARGEPVPVVAPAEQPRPLLRAVGAAPGGGDGGGAMAPVGAKRAAVAPRESVLQLNTSSLKVRTPCDPDVLLCLDFGTAMSKAFATVEPDDHLELELGTTAGESGYGLPSSVFIDDDGMVLFGHEALERSQTLEGSSRKRMDSIKAWLSQQNDGHLDTPLGRDMNPCVDYPLTQGDLIRVYLAYLTDMALESLGLHPDKSEAIGRLLKRRYARPCWPDSAKVAWAERLMRELLSEAQVLADTFHGKWTGGIHISDIKRASTLVRQLPERPDYLIDEGVPEPVAVAAGAIAEAKNFRDAFMVVDAGAGTTDFGLFVAVRNPQDTAAPPRVFQIGGSIKGLMQAGDRVDSMLRGFIAQREAIDTADTSGQILLAALGREIRSLKETLFRTGAVSFLLNDGTPGEVTLQEFLGDKNVKNFARLVEQGFHDALAGVDDSWLRWLAMDGVRLHVVLTGGSSNLPMMRGLGTGPIKVGDYTILRERVDPTPAWMDEMSDEFRSVYPQLAVAIGGAADELPETLAGPLTFSGGSGKARYVAGRLQISGN